MTPRKVFEKKYPVGLSIYKWDDDKQYTITGNIAKEYRFRDFDGNYDVEDYLQSKLDCSGIDFDSEFSQFFAYADTEKKAVEFMEEVQAWFDNLKKLID